eukprot:scaffold27953_cov75-Phaeocystis_antarctica.AAC.1
MATDSHVMPPERADDRDILTRAACPAEWVPLLGRALQEAARLPRRRRPHAAVRARRDRVGHQPVLKWLAHAAG